MYELMNKNIIMYLIIFIGKIPEILKALNTCYYYYTDQISLSTNV